MPRGPLDRMMKKASRGKLKLCLLPIEFSAVSVRAVQISQSSVANSAAEKDDVALYVSKSVPQGLKPNLC